MLTNRLRRKRKKYLVLYNKERLIYQGNWNDIPFSDNIILDKSISFFNDPEPCYIHRSAVRVRLLSELEKELDNYDKEIPESWLKKLSEYTAFPNITHAEFTEI